MIAERRMARLIREMPATAGDRILAVDVTTIETLQFSCADARWVVGATVGVQRICDKEGRAIHVDHRAFFERRDWPSVGVNSETAKVLEQRLCRRALRFAKQVVYNSARCAAAPNLVIGQSQSVFDPTSQLGVFGSMMLTHEIPNEDLTRIVSRCAIVNQAPPINLELVLICGVVTPNDILVEFFAGTLCRSPSNCRQQQHYSPQKDLHWLPLASGGRFEFDALQPQDIKIRIDVLHQRDVVYTERAAAVR